MAIVKGHFGEIQLGLAAHVEIERIAGRIDTVIRIDPLLIARDRLGVGPDNSFARRQRNYCGAPPQRRQINQRTMDDDCATSGVHDNVCG
jgi:hypothetical protein